MIYRKLTTFLIDFDDLRGRKIKVQQKRPCNWEIFAITEMQREIQCEELLTLRRSWREKNVVQGSVKIRPALSMDSVCSVLDPMSALFELFAVEVRLPVAWSQIVRLFERAKILSLVAIGRAPSPAPSHRF
jgi:hypothetical protein